MHADEFPIDVTLVSNLIASQFPQWASLPVSPVASAGTDNALFQLGDELVVRLPRIPGAVGQVEKEQVWLPRLAPCLPLTIPAPMAAGVSDTTYPWPWSVNRWVRGGRATLDQLSDPDRTARDLAGFIRSLQQIDTTDGPPPGDHNSGRGVPLAVRDSGTCTAIAACDGLIDTQAATALWNRAVNAPVHTTAPVWIHGDLQSGNLLEQDGRLVAVIDFGCLAVGDPAVDLLPAWNLFAPEARETFRQAMDVDDVTWLRGMGWALSVSVIALPYYQHTNPVLADISRYAIAQVLSATGS